MSLRLGPFRKALARSGRTWAEIRRALVVLFEYRRPPSSQYRFTAKDAVLFGLERAWRPRSAEVHRGSIPGLSPVTVGASAVYWPIHPTADGITWMRKEVNAPFWRNSSSYPHPEVTRGRSEWVVDGGSCEGFFADSATRSLDAPKVFCIEAWADVADALRSLVAPQIESGEIQGPEVTFGTLLRQNNVGQYGVSVEATRLLRDVDRKPHDAASAVPFCNQELMMGRLGRNLTKKSCPTRVDRPKANH